MIAASCPVPDFLSLDSIAVRESARDLKFPWHMTKNVALLTKLFLVTLIANDPEALAPLITHVVGKQKRMNLC